MNGRIVLGVFIALVLVAGAVTLGYYAYSVGVAQGMLDSGKIALPATGVAPVMPYRAGPFFHPFHWGFGTCLMPLLFFFIVFIMLRAIFFPRHWGRHCHHGEKGYPPMFDEWHKQMHETKSNESSRT